MNNNFYLCFYDSVIVSYYKVVLIRIYLFIYLFALYYYYHYYCNQLFKLINYLIR